jgi:hypothetical protein
MHTFYLCFRPLWAKGHVFPVPLPLRGMWLMELQVCSREIGFAGLVDLM